MTDPTNPIQSTPSIQPVQWQRLEKADQVHQGDEFQDVLGKLIQEVDQAQKSADDSIQSLAVGENENLQDVVLKMEEAELTFRLMKQIRDKLIQAYKEVISIQ